jgi:Predicted NTP pyrophosphohydrolase
MSSNSVPASRSTGKTAYSSISFSCVRTGRSAAKKDSGTWTIPKGIYGEGEDPLAVPQREFAEENGSEITGPVSSAAAVQATEREGGVRVDCGRYLDTVTWNSNTFPLACRLVRERNSAFLRWIVAPGSTFSPLPGSFSRTERLSRSVAVLAE